MDYKEYKAIYNQLLSEQGRAEVGSDTKNRAELEAKINTFLEAYPKTIPADRNPLTPVWRLSLTEITRRCISTAIDIINDLSEILSERENLSGTEVRRKIFVAFTLPERRLYVGIWFIVVSFILYFIDSAA